VNIVRGSGNTVLNLPPSQTPMIYELTRHGFWPRELVIYIGIVNILLTGTEVNLDLDILPSSMQAYILHSSTDLPLTSPQEGQLAFGKTWQKR
jgi:hypothetical protein